MPLHRAFPAALLVLAAACSLTPIPSVSELPPPTRRFVEIEGGRMRYAVQGEGEAVVLINGGGIDLRQWDGTARELAARGFRVVRYDPRGWGGTPAATEPFSQADDLAALLEALAIPRAHVVGLSWGGGVALDFALAHPRSVERLVLVGPAVGGYPWSRDFGQRGARFAQAADTPRVRLLLDDPYFAPGARGDATLTAWIRTLLLENTRALRLPTRLERPLDPPAFRRLEQVRAPTLIVTAERDHPELRAAGDSLERRIPGAREVVVPGAGHMVNLERPAELARILAEFLRVR